MARTGYLLDHAEVAEISGPGLGHPSGEAGSADHGTKGCLGRGTGVALTQLPVIRDQIQGRRLVSHRSQKPRNLTPMVSSVIYHVQDNLPPGGGPGVALQIMVRRYLRYIFVSQARGPILPRTEHCRPFALQEI